MPIAPSLIVSLSRCRRQKVELLDDLGNLRPLGGVKTANRLGEAALLRPPCKLGDCCDHAQATAVSGEETSQRLQH